MNFFVSFNKVYTLFRATSETTLLLVNNSWQNIYFHKCNEGEYVYVNVQIVFKNR